MKIVKTFTWDSAHILPNHSGRCRRLHGHTYRMDVEVEGFKTLDRDSSSEGMLVDFGDIKAIVDENIIKRWDHHFLAKGDEWPARAVAELNGPPIDDQVVIVGFRTTAENMAAYAAREIAKFLRSAYMTKEIYVVVRIWETPTSYAQAGDEEAEKWLAQSQ